MCLLVLSEYQHGIPWTISFKLCDSPPWEIKIWLGSASVSPLIQEICCHLYIGLSFVRAALACTILERTYGYEPPSETIAPRYLKLVSVTSFCSLTLISHWMSLVLFVISFVFSALISISAYLIQRTNQHSCWYYEQILHSVNHQLSFSGHLLYEICSTV